MIQFQKRQIVRLIKYPKNHMNSLGRVDEVFEDGSIWIKNLNMPFAGTINKKYSPKMIEKEIRKL